MYLLPEGSGNQLNHVPRQKKREDSLQHNNVCGKSAEKIGAKYG